MFIPAIVSSARLFHFLQQLCERSCFDCEKVSGTLPSYGADLALEERTGGYLISGELNRPMTHEEERRHQPFVQSRDAIGLEDFDECVQHTIVPHADRRSLGCDLSLLQLQAGLDKPNGISRETCQEARERCTPEIHCGPQLPTRIHQGRFPPRDAPQQVVAVEVGAPGHGRAQQVG